MVGVNYPIPGFRFAVVLAGDPKDPFKGVKDSMASYALIGRHSEAKIQL